MLWTEYRYKEEDYDSLIRSLKRVSKHRYGVLLKDPPKLKGYPTGPRVFRVPEGWVILSPKPYTRYHTLQDLRKPIRLVPFIIFLAGDRLRLQINRDYVRLQLKRARALSSSAYWYGSRRKRERDYIKAVNNLTRELKAIDRVAFVYPQTKIAYNRKLRWIVHEFMTSVLGLSSRLARWKMAQYLISF